MRMFVEPLAVYLHREPVDFRQSINGLTARVEGTMHLSPLSGALFLFCNRQRTRLKLLYWDHTGFALWHKRLEEARFRWPRQCDAVLTLTEGELHALLQGYDIVRSDPHKILHYSRVL
ncbi:MAG: IS66 family insertion sequence element accessory protein TnpB [Acidiferrobacteraceae bacterium]